MFFVGVTGALTWAADSVTCDQIIHGMSPLYLSDCIAMCIEIVGRDSRASISNNMLLVP